MKATIARERFEHDSSCPPSFANSSSCGHSVSLAAGQGGRNLAAYVFDATIEASRHNGKDCLTIAWIDAMRDLLTIVFAQSGVDVPLTHQLIEWVLISKKLMNRIDNQLNVEIKR